MSSVSLRGGRRDKRGRSLAFRALLLLSLAIGFVTLGALLVDVVQRGLPFLDGALFTADPSVDPLIAGARPAILGTLYMMVLLVLFAVPIGIGTAIYLEEYADQERWWNRALEINIPYLAAVP